LKRFRASKNNAAQLSLLDKGKMSADDFQRHFVSKKRKQPEKEFMNKIIELAAIRNLRALHIKNYCGNRFNHVCPKCHTPSLVTCHNILNADLAGEPDILGISWAIETKNKVNKGKQTAKLDPRQKLKGSVYDSFGVPHLTANQSDINQVIEFLDHQAQVKQKPKE
jgi:hypothetical protein